MAQTRASIEEADRDLMRKLGLLVPLWTLAFLLASVGLVVYGDALLALLT